MKVRPRFRFRKPFPRIRTLTVDKSNGIRHRFIHERIGAFAAPQPKRAAAVCPVGYTAAQNRFCPKLMHQGPAPCRDLNSPLWADNTTPAVRSKKRAVEKGFFMKKGILGFLAAAVAVALVAVPIAADENVFTITDIPGEYEGKFVFLIGEDESGADFAGFQSHNTETEVFTLPEVADGQVVIPMWDNLGADGEGRWEGDATVSFVVGIFDSGEVGEDGDAQPLARMGFVNVAFNGGIATMSFLDAVDPAAN